MAADGAGAARADVLASGRQPRRFRWPARPVWLLVDVWATGLAGAGGTADLTGYTWTGAVADSYWLALEPSPAGAPPGLHGRFGQGQKEPFPQVRHPARPHHEPAGPHPGPGRGRPVVYPGLP